MEYKWLLFDADGTLFDYDRAEASALCTTLEQFGVPFTPERLTTYRRIGKRLWTAMENGLITPGALGGRIFEAFFEEIQLDLSPEVGASKPDPAVFDAAFERIGRPLKSEVLMIGDSLTSDMEGGHRYGMDTCWYNPTNQSQSVGLEITYQIRSLGELTDLL